MHLIRATLDRIAKISDKGSQFTDLLAIRRCMSTIQKRDLLPIKMLCDRLIGNQHKIFNDLGCHIALIRHHIHSMSLRIQNDLCLRKIKINGSPLHTLLANQTG